MFKKCLIAYVLLMLGLAAGFVIGAISFVTSPGLISLSITVICGIAFYAVLKLTKWAYRKTKNTVQNSELFEIVRKVAREVL